MPPQVNAALTGVRSGGRVDDWESSGATPAARWSGAADAYYVEREVKETGPGGATNRRLKRELIVDVDVVLEQGIDTGDVLTFAWQGRELEARATIVPRPALAGIPAGLATSRIVLEDL